VPEEPRRDYVVVQATFFALPPSFSVLQQDDGIMDESREYMIEWNQPDGYDPWGVLQTLPSPISREGREIYNYSVKPEGFYLIDRGIDLAIAGHALKIFVDEALRYSDYVTVRRL
jgi:hypothetical protein